MHDVTRDVIVVFGALGAMDDEGGLDSFENDGNATSASLHGGQ